MLRRTERERDAIFLALYLAFVVFITLLTRVPIFTGIAHWVPFWSYRLGTKNAGQILLNIVLFLPRGYYFAALFRARHALLAAFSVSICLEITQLVTNRGTPDVDDVISNSLGALAGIALYRLLMRKGSAKSRRATRVVLIAAGFIGCAVAVSSSARSIDAELMKYFSFDIEELRLDGTAAAISGQCHLYNQPTPEYTILLDNTAAETTIEGEHFSAAAELLTDKAEVRIRFKGFAPMPTGTYLRKTGNQLRVEYVPGNVIEPDGAEGVLAAYSPDYDIFVFQNGNKLVWYIGSDIDPASELICHLYTSEPEKLPEKRLLFGFDNRGFRIVKQKEAAYVGSYRVYTIGIPSEYRITAVVVGLKTGGSVAWKDCFRPL